MIIIIGMLSPMISNKVCAQLNTDRLTAIGRNALYFDDYVLSIQYFNQVINLKPYLYEPYQLRAIAKIQLGDMSGALQDCNRAIELNPFQPGTYYTRGFIYRQQQDYELAEQDFNQALQFAPENKTYLILRADVLAQCKKYDQALNDLDYLLRREPHSASLLFERGVVCMSKQDTLGALNAFAQTIRYDSQNPSNWSALGVTNLMLGNDSEALQNLNQAILLGSKWAGDYLNRGIIHYRSHNYRGALADYDQAVSIAPNDAQSYYNRGVLRHELGDYNNALSDFNQAIDLQPEQTEMYYQRATTLMQLRQWQQAVQDFEVLIERYPYFMPSYYLAAQAKTALGDTKGAYLYRQTAYELEQKKDSIMAQSVNTDVQIAKTPSTKRDRRKEFSSRAAQNQAEPTAEDQQYSSDTRGAIQRNYTDVINEPNIVLSYFQHKNSIRRTNYSHSALDKFNQTHWLPSPLYVTISDATISADMLNMHFERIASISQQLKQTANWSLYFSRAIEFAIVQDYTSAVDDATRALLDVHEAEAEAMILFCRANWRYQQLLHQQLPNENNGNSALEFGIMLKDYDRVITLYPNFIYAYYNKANMLCTQRDFQSAIELYSQAIQIDSDFAEAYFNRGLTRIYIGDNEAGINDLSKAGELGIYQAYNLISRFK